MSLKDVLRTMINTFFVILGSGFIIMYLFVLFFWNYTVLVEDLTCVLVLCILVTLSLIVFYSKKELVKTRLLMRYIIHFFIVLGLVMGMGHLRNWYTWYNPSHIIGLVVMTAAANVVVILWDYYRTKRLSKLITFKLLDRYK